MIASRARAAALAAAALVVVLAALAPLPRARAAGARDAEPGITRAQADSILSQLRAIRQLLERGAAPVPRAIPPQPERTVTLPPSLSSWSLGRADAPLTLVEFADTECSYCRQFQTTVFETLRARWIDTGKLRFVARDLPLEFHKHSQAAASAARCAGEQGKFWEMRRVLTINDDRLDSLAFGVYASDLGLDTTRFAACMRERRFDAAIHKDATDAQAAGITGTPTFVLGRTTKAGVEGTVIVGAIPYADLDARLRRLLETK